MHKTQTPFPTIEDAIDELEDALHDARWIGDEEREERLQRELNDCYARRDRGERYVIPF